MWISLIVLVWCGLWCLVGLCNWLQCRRIVKRWRQSTEGRAKWRWHKNDQIATVLSGPLNCHALLWLVDPRGKEVLVAASDLLDS